MVELSGFAYNRPLGGGEVWLDFNGNQQIDDADYRVPGKVDSKGEYRGQVPETLASLPIMVDTTTTESRGQLPDVLLAPQGSRVVSPFTHGLAKGMITRDDIPENFNPLTDNPYAEMQNPVQQAANTIPPSSPNRLRDPYDPNNPEGGQRYLVSQDKIETYREVFERAMAEFEAIANLKFVEVSEVLDTHAMMHVDITWSNAKSGAASLNVHRGGYIRIDHPHHYSTVLHEIAHALGVKHPFEEDAGFPADPAEKRLPNSIASYANENIRVITQNDINVLQLLYGAPGTNFAGLQSIIDDQDTTFRQPSIIWVSSDISRRASEIAGIRTGRHQTRRRFGRGQGERHQQPRQKTLGPKPATAKHPIYV